MNSNSVCRVSPRENSSVITEYFLKIENKKVERLCWLHNNDFIYEKNKVIKIITLEDVIKIFSSWKDKIDKYQKFE